MRAAVRRPARCCSRRTTNGASSSTRTWTGARAASCRPIRAPRCCSFGRACGSQLGAWASVQSETLASREAFETHLAEVAARFDDRDVPRPPRWSGFRIVPRTVEFWYGGEDRLHERYLHEASDAGTWSTRMLQP